MSIASTEKPDSARREEVSQLVAKQFLSHAGEGLPLYLRLHKCVEDLIKSGTLTPGTQMPPEQSLASALGISLGTAQKGLQSLSSKRLIVREHGRGTFVSEPRHSLTELRLFRFLDPETDSLLPVYASILDRQLVAPTPELVAVLGEDPGGYVRLSRLVDVDGRFTCYSELFLPASLFGQVMHIPMSDFENVNLKRLFAERLDIEADVYSHKIRVTRASDKVRELLGLTSHATGMEMEIIERTSKNITTVYQRIFVPPTRYSLDIRYGTSVR
jgi:GntR family transcriptional regulator